MHNVGPFPLYWPLQHPRTARRHEGAFSVDFVRARSQLLGELDRLGAREVLISSNVPIRRDGLPAVPDREPTDPGVAVYFTRKSTCSSTCSSIVVVAWRSIARSASIVRPIARMLYRTRVNRSHAMTTFSGFAALPAPSQPKTWRDVLGIPPGPIDRETLYDKWRELARIHHPDVGGDNARMAEINVAYERACAELGGAL